MDGTGFESGQFLRVLGLPWAGRVVVGVSTMRET